MERQRRLVGGRRAWGEVGVLEGSGEMFDVCCEELGTTVQHEVLEYVWICIHMGGVASAYASDTRFLHGVGEHWIFLILLRLKMA